MGKRKGVVREAAGAFAQQIEGRDMTDRAAIAKLTAKIEQLTHQVETQAETIRAQNIKLLRLQREAKARADA